MADSDIGIGISIKINKIIIDDKEIKKIRDEVNSKLEGKLKADISFNWSKASLDETLSKIREKLKTNPLKIEIKTYANMGSINSQIVGIQNKLKNINVGNVNLNNQTKTSDSENNFYKKEITTIKELDGTITKLTRTYNKNGEIIEEVSKKIDKQKESVKSNVNQQQSEIKKLTDEYTKYGKVIQTIEKQNALGKTTGFQRTSRDEKTGVLTTEYFKAGQESAYKITNNIEKIKQAELKAQEQIRNAILQTEQTRRKEQEKSAQAQAKANNKAKEQEYQVQQQEQLRIKRLGEKVTGAGRINFDASDGELRRYAESVAGAGAEVGRITTRIDTAGRRIREVNVRVNEGGRHWRNYRMTLDQATNSLYRTDRGLTDVRNRQMSFNEALRIAVIRIAQWGIATNLVYGGLNQLRMGLQTLKEIDTELINIAKVTEYTNEQMKQLTQTAINAGKEYGRTAQEYLQAVTTFARAGMGQQSEEYAKLSLLLQNVGDVAADTANETLIAANAGFQLGGSYEALMGVIDKFNNISNKNATDITKLSDAMKVGASVFNSAGMSMDETISIIGTATASTQRSGSEISRAWRTILMNIRQVADEEAEVTEESMKKAEKALNSVGIVVRDSPSTFRPMFEIIRDLGKDWKNLSEVEQAYVAESLAGKRQANVLISTLQNWDMAEKQLTESIQSNGSALQENEIYMQSWEARSKQLSATITEFWSHFINTDSVKGFISSLTTLISILDKLVNNSFSSFLMQTGLITGVIALLNAGFGVLKTTLVGTAIGVFALDVAEKGLIVTTKALTTTLLASPLFWAVVATAGVMGIVKAVDALTVSFEEQKEIVTNLSSEISSLQTEYDQLKNKENKTSEEESYLKLLEKELEIKKELNKTETKKLMNEEFFSYDSLNMTGINEVNSYITSIRNLKEELANAETKTEADNLKEEILSFEEKLIKSQKSIANYKNTLGEIPPELQALSDAIAEILNSNNVDNSDKTKEKLDGIAGSADNLNTSLKSLQDTMSSGISKIKSYNQALDEYNKNGKFNLETIINLAKEQPQLLTMLGDESALRQELTRLVNEENEAIQTAYANKIQLSEEFYNAAILGNKTLVNELEKDYNIDLSNYKNLAEMKLAVEKNLLSSVAGMWAKFYNAQGEFVGKFADAGRTVIDQQGNETYVTPEMRKQLGAYLKGVRDIENRFNNIVLNTTKVDFKGIGLSSSSGSSSSSSSQFTKTLDLSKQKLEENTQLVEKLKDELDDALTYDQRATIFDKINEAYTQRLSILQQIKKMENDQLYIVTQQIQKSKVLTAEQKKQVLNGDFTNLNLKGDKYKAIAETIDQYQSLKSAMASTVAEMNGIDDSIRENIFAKINDNITVAQDSISKYNTELDISQSKIQLLTEGTDEYNQELKNQTDLRQKIVDASANLQKYVEQELQNDKLNIEQKRQLQQIYDDLTKSILNQQIAVKQTIEKTIDDAISLIKDSIKEREELEIKAIQAEIDAEQERHDQRIKNLDDEYSKFEENINKQIALIDEQADEDEFNKQLKEAQDKRNETMQQISVFSMDDSFEAKARVAELQKQLAEQNASIEDMQNKRTIDLRKKNLQDQLDKFKTEIDEKKETENARFDAFKEEKEKEKEEMQLYYEEMLKNEQYFQSLKKRAAEKGTSELKKILDDYLKYFNTQNETYTGKIGASWQEVLNTINAIIAMQDQLGGIPAGMITPIPGGGTTTPSTGGGDTSEPTQPQVQLPSGWAMNSSTGGIHKDIWSMDWGVSSTGVIYKNGSFVPATNYNYVPDEVLDIARRRKAGEFYEGGVGDYTGYALLHGTKQKSEVIFNAEQAKKLYNLVANLPQNLLTSNFSIPNISNTLQKIVNSLKPQPTVATSAGNVNVYVSIDKMVAKDEGQANQVFTTIANKIYGRGKKL